MMKDKAMYLIVGELQLKVRGYNKEGGDHDMMHSFAHYIYEL
jgi:hypothetical protein